MEPTNLLEPFIGESDLNWNEYKELLSQKLKSLHNQGIDGNGVTIVMVDTNIDVDLDLDGKLKIIEGDQIFTPKPRGEKAHANLVALTLHRIAPGADIIPLPILNNGLDATEDLFICALNKVRSIKNGLNHSRIVVNISVELSRINCPGTCFSCQAVNNLIEEEIFVVAAAGNQGERSLKNTISCPGASMGSLTIGAVCENGEVCPFSGRGPRFDGLDLPDIVAPCVIQTDVHSTFNVFGEKKKISHAHIHRGTSFSTPVMSGAAALLLCTNHDMTVSDIKKSLLNNAKIIRKNMDKLIIPRKYIEGKGITFFWEAFNDR